MEKLIIKSLPQVNDKGFTLIEALIVLSIVIIISSISLLQLRPLHESKKMDQFLEQLQNDIFLSQQYAISNSDPTTLYFSSSGSYYRLTRGNSQEVLLLRKIDPAIRIQFTTLGQYLVFTSNGNIQRAGEIRFRYKDRIYVVTFLLGKGRFYVSKG
ncbi:prepilin-type N-terminal cleavage/methylation domain-containing protein [Bacillus sp. HNG]|uniref:competence type IV pilus minor pilin ComGD n=1 Tax=Bacillus sp. HNG TaxID=2293325 RepID=UPI000E2F6A31|nr:competence type IV pilus minor pilin ComGD [Bacillus sp. HNG]RFB10562.1 prepilin-type N-terminal cleavage/methylation domain-containing protein [Bacillus sp. HNG]